MAYFEKYDSLEDLVQDKSLTKKEKISLLEQWREDEEDLQRASYEGMRINGQQSILKQVETALTSLKEEP